MLIKRDGQMAIVNIDAVTTIIVRETGLNTDGSTYMLSDYEIIKKAIEYFKMMRK